MTTKRHTVEEKGEHASSSSSSERSPTYGAHTHTQLGCTMHAPHPAAYSLSLSLISLPLLTVWLHLLEIVFMSAGTFIVDVGSQTLKVGSSTAAAPTVVPTIAGTPRFPPALHPVIATPFDSVGRTRCVGRDAMTRRSLLRLHAPVHAGVIVDWPSARGVLEQGVRLSVTEQTSAGEEAVLALVEHPFASRVQRQRLVEAFLETGGGEDNAGAGAGARPSSLASRPLTGVFCGVAPLLALYATGATTGVALEVGHDVMSTAAAVAGTSLPGSLLREDGHAGAAVTRLFEHLLRQSGASFGARSGAGLPLGSGSSAERELLREVKERVCAVAAGGASPSAAAEPVHEAAVFDLPDGTQLTVGPEARFNATEVLFTPELVGLEGRGASELLDDAVAKAGPELACELRQNVVVSGGTSLTPGFAQRCFRDLQSRAPTSEAVRLVAPAARATAPWFGVALLSQLSTYATHMVVSREDYEENGESILQSRLFT